MVNKKLLTVLLSTGVILSAATYAQDKSPDFSELIKSSIEKYIEDIKVMDEKKNVTFDGTVLVEPNTGYYAVTLPDIDVNISDMGALNLGMIAANVTPKENGEWRVSMALPETISLSDKDDVEKVLSFNKQKIVGTWDPGFGFFSDVDATVNNVRYVDVSNKLDVNVDTMNRVIKILKKGDRSSTINNIVTAKNIKGNLLGSNNNFSIQQASINIAHNNVVLEGYVDYLKQLFVKGDFGVGVQGLGQFVGNGKNEIQLSNIQYDLPDDFGLEKGSFISIGKVALNTSFSKNNANLSDYKFHLSATGKLNEGKETQASKKNQTLLFDAELSNVNGSEFSQASGIEDGSFDIANAIGYFKTSQGILNLKNFEISFSSGASVKLNGQLKPYALSEIGWAGVVNLVVENPNVMIPVANLGVDKLSENLEGVSEIFAEQFKLGTALLQSLGNVEPGVNGQSTMAVKFELTEDGKILLNDQEFQSPFGSFIPNNVANPTMDDEIDEQEEGLVDADTDKQEEVVDVEEPVIAPVVESVNEDNAIPMPPALPTPDMVPAQ